MTPLDRWIGGLFFIFGFLVIREASKLDFASSYGAGSGFFPYWLGISTVILGAVLTLLALRNHKAIPLHAASEGWSKKKTLAYGVLLVFVHALELLGFVIAFIFLVAFLLKLEGEQWRSAIFVAFASGAGFYLFFIRLLDVKLPLGPLGF